MTEFHESQNGSVYREPIDKPEVTAITPDQTNPILNSFVNITDALLHSNEANREVRNFRRALSSDR
jgi:hypothetical protein